MSPNDARRSRARAGISMKVPRALSISRAVGTSNQHPWSTLAAVLILCVLAGWYISGHFKMTSDTTQLFSPTVDWRRNEITLTKAFPQNSDNIIVVVEGATPELAEQAATVLAEKLTPQTKIFAGVRRPDGGAFFTREGLLFLSRDELATTTDQLVSAQPFIGLFSELQDVHMRRWIIVFLHTIAGAV